MKIAKTLLLLLITISGKTFAQGTFQSITNGNWNAPATWILQSGNSSVNYPVAGDTVIITGKNTITVNTTSACYNVIINDTSSLLCDTTAAVLTVSNSFTITAASSVIMNQGLMTITGSLTQNARSAITINQGAITVIGIALISAPSSSGTTLLDVEGGAFTCAGGMSITGITSTRLAELRIGNSAVNVAGGLATFSANAKINFTGTGSLTLAGIINISNASGFIPGNGRVIYVGIPGTDQVIAPLTYNRLVITGLDSGLKKIDGAVTVTDTLTLLTDTLSIDAGGLLTMNDNTVLVKTAGKIITPPTYAGKVDIVYNNILKDTTGMEIPVSTGVLRNITINDIAGITMNTDVTVNNSISLQQGGLFTNNHSLFIASDKANAIADSSVLRVNGYITGTIIRNIGTTTGIRNFPFGISLLNGYRGFQIAYTSAPVTAGKLTVAYFDTAASMQSGLPLADGSVVISKTAGMYWQADAATLSGGLYNLSLTDEGATGVSDIAPLRIVKRLTSGGAWTFNGIAGINSGTTTAPVIVRNGMSGFSQFTYGSDNTNTLPLQFLNFTGKLSGRNITLTWAVANNYSNSYFEIESGNNGKDFSLKGKVNASTSQAAYSFTDYNVSDTYYRLKQVNADNSFTYSNVIFIKINKSNALRIYPTLASQQITVEATSDENIKVYDANGKFMQKLMPGNNDISKLSAGMYYVTDETKNVVQFIKQ